MGYKTKNVVFNIPSVMNYVYPAAEYMKSVSASFKELLTELGITYTSQLVTDTIPTTTSKTSYYYDENITVPGCKYRFYGYSRTSAGSAIVYMYPSNNTESKTKGYTTPIKYRGEYSRYSICVASNSNGTFLNLTPIDSFDFYGLATFNTTDYIVGGSNSLSIVTSSKDTTNINEVNEAELTFYPVNPMNGVRNPKNVYDANDETYLMTDLYSRDMRYKVHGCKSISVPRWGRLKTNTSSYTCIGCIAIED